MSDKDLRRPRRIIPGPELPPPPPPATLQQAERFQRSLMQGRRHDLARGEAPAARAAAPTMPAAARSPAPPAAGAAPAPLQQRPLSPLARLQAALDTAELQEPPPQEATEPAHGAAAQPAAWQDEPAWEQELAEMVATLCSKADPAFQTWTVMVPLNPAVLPDTELRLSLSPERLSLRFQSGSAVARQLVLSHRPQLQRLLEQSLGHLRDIDIDLP